MLFQCWFYNETLKTLERCAKEMKIEDTQEEGANINQILDQIKSLSITSDD